MRHPALVLLVAVPPLASCAREPAATLSAEPASAVAEEFKRVADDLYAGRCPQYGRAPREGYEKELADPSLPNGKRLQTQLELSGEYLESGEVTRAIELLEQNLALAKKVGNEKQYQKAERALAEAWLRESENENCIQRHNAECCIMPPRAGAVHAVKRPAEESRKLYQAVLAENPNDLDARWLVNLTTLVLGESLEDLPADQRLPPRAFGEVTGEPLFRDIGAKAGIDASSLAGGVAVEDFDGDGLLDVITSTCDPRGSMHYFRSSGDGTFEDLAEEAGLSVQFGGLNMISADFDEDGDQDPLVLRGGWLVDFGCVRRSLLRNDGGRHFEDVTRAAGLAEPAYPSQAATFGDFDGDGDLDLYVGNESCIDVKREDCMGDYPSQYFQNDGRAVFTDVAGERGVRNDHYAKGVAAGDYDDDGDLDLYVSNIGPNCLYRNDGSARFEEVAAQAGVTEPSGRSFACWFFDFDEDGHLDLWVSGYSATIGDLAADSLGLPNKGVPMCLYRNLANGRFEDVAAKTGVAHPWLPMASNFGDADGDGWQDIYLGTGDPHLYSLMPNVYLHNLAGQAFADETATSGLGHLQKGHGIGFADFDGDGDQDIFHKMGGFVPVDAYASALFENRSPPGNHWLKLSLVGTKTNRDAVGARVEVHLETPAGARVLHRAPGCVASFAGSPHRLEIGLGDARRITSLEVKWPNGGSTQVFDDVPLDAWVRVTEGETALERLEVRSFRF